MVLLARERRTFDPTFPFDLVAAANGRRVGDAGRLAVDLVSSRGRQSPWRNPQVHVTQRVVLMSSEVSNDPTKP